MAVEQQEKIRIVLNASLPENLSFNSNIKNTELEKVYMSSARKFGYSVIRAGKGAIMSKFDLCDAYKNIRCKKEDFRLQGFFWLGKFFFENRLIFGVISSVCNYDIFGNTVECLAISDSSIPSDFVHRQLDDVPVVGPANKDWCSSFSFAYKNLCDEIGVKLAPDCEKFEKAFTNSKFGKVLGIFFDSENLKWSLPSEKKDKCLRAISFCYNSDSINLVSMQKLVGRLNDISIMCPFLSAFKRSILDDMCRFVDENIVSISLSSQSKKDLLIWVGMLTDPDCWLPIPHEPCAPTIFHKEFFSDAAGCALDDKVSSGPGAACIGFDEDGCFCFAKRISWDRDMISLGVDNAGVRLGDKSTFLEFIGVLLPFLLIPNLLKNQHLVFYVDNLNCIFGWDSKSLKGDKLASIVIRAILLISSFLECVVHFRHVPRVSNWESKMADRMSREKSLRSVDLKLLHSFENLGSVSVLSNWLVAPSEDWNFPFRLLAYVKSKCTV